MEQKKEAVYLINDERYLHLRENGAGVGFATYNKVTGEPLESGQISEKNLPPDGRNAISAARNWYLFELSDDDRKVIQQESVQILENMPIGCMVTLRGERMYDFLDRLVTIAFPRVRDFRGVSGRAFDGRGNYNIGLREQIIFPEIEYDKIDAVRGLNISITTTAKTDEEAKALLAGFRFPFRN